MPRQGLYKRSHVVACPASYAAKRNELFITHYSPRSRLPNASTRARRFFTSSRMETRLPTSSRSRNLGSRFVPIDQDAGTMVAQAGTSQASTCSGNYNSLFLSVLGVARHVLPLKAYPTVELLIPKPSTGSTASGMNNSISRSMSRYKGNRRNMDPSYPASPPKIHPAHEQQLQHLRMRDQSNVDGNTSAHGSDPQQEAELRPRRRAQSIKTPESGRERRARDARQDHQGTPLGEPNVMFSIPSREQPTKNAITGSRRVNGVSDIPHALVDGRARAKTQSEDALQTFNFCEEPAEAKISRPMYERYAKSQDEVPPSTRPVAVRQITRERIGTSPPRLKRQVTRPQAFEKSNNTAELKRMISGPIPIEPKGVEVSPPKESEEPVVAPRFDAPISAVNAGSRMVRVKYEGTEISVPITPSTTPLDIIRATARQSSAPIDERSTVVLEAFKQVGLERPLRKYEHIRDVLNSWDYDAQNTLLIVKSPTGGKDDDLDAENVSKSQPGETTVYIHHSQKPGHWDKRWVTLRSDGQVVVAKKNGGESTNICHLSDFDIYIPTPRNTSKKIKPPKKVCFAVKSQQKSSMFMITANFVHFFSTSDRQLATSWYKAVQEWRSWYLVNVMGEGQKVKDVSRDPATNNIRRGVVNDTSALQHTFAGPESRKQEDSQPAASISPIKHPKTKVGPSSYPPNVARNTSPFLNQQHQPQISPPPDPFAPTSLLGCTYTQRQKAQQRTSYDDLPPALPPPTLGHAHPPPSTTSSTRRPPKPLVDLTPQYQPPPQHTRKGRGVKPEQIPAGGLVEVATSPKVTIQTPPSREWRRPEAVRDESPKKEGRVRI